MKKILFSALLASSLTSAYAEVFQYAATFSDVGEAKPSSATGSGTVVYDDVLHTLALQVTFSGLNGNTTAAHIHAPTEFAGTGSAGVATTTPSFTGFPLGVTSGTFTSLLDLTQASSWNPSFVTAHGGTTAQAETDLAAAIAGGKAYFNIHTVYGGGGEIRAFLVPVPEPGMLTMLGLSLGGFAWAMTRRTPRNS